MSVELKHNQNGLTVVIVSHNKKNLFLCDYVLELKNCIMTGEGVWQTGITVNVEKEHTTKKLFHITKQTLFITLNCIVSFQHGKSLLKL